MSRKITRVLRALVVVVAIGIGLTPLISDALPGSNDTTLTLRALKRSMATLMRRLIARIHRTVLLVIAIQIDLTTRLALTRLNITALTARTLNGNVTAEIIHALVNRAGLLIIAIGIFLTSHYANALPRPNEATLT